MVGASRLRPSEAAGGWARARRIGALVALACVALSIANELLHWGQVDPVSDRTAAVLLSLALLCIVGLTERRAPSLAWVCAAAAAALAAIDIVGVDRLAGVASGGTSGSVLVGATVVRAAPAFIATGYLLSRSSDRWVTVVRVVATAGIALTVAALLGALVEGWLDPKPFDGDWSRAANRVVLIDVGIALAAGAWLDMVPGWRRARLRWRRAGRAMPWPERLRVLGDELLPLAATERRAAIEGERSSLAAALHATVLPPLRSALAASQAGSKEAAERGLGEAVDEVEQLMASREPVIVDALGLLPGLEWLAERLQVRSGIAVEIDVEATSGRPPNNVERAAFRVAQLALDNAGRHSEATEVRIAGTVAPRAVALTVDDDGRGFAPDGATHGRGLRDMRTTAESVRASVTVGPSGSEQVDRRPGTRVRFDWSSR